MRPNLPDRLRARPKLLELDPRILPDMGIKVTFLGDDTSSKAEASSPAIVIPQNAIHDESGKKVVYLVRGDKAERRAVTVAGNRGSDTEIIAGVIVGDAVIVNAPANLHDGESVQIKR